MPADLPPLSVSAWLRWDVVERLVRGRPIRTVLEIGAGLGGFGARFARRWSYLGLEPDARSAAVAAARIAPHGGSVLNATTDALPAEARFDLVCAFEVLEHLEDDAAALADWVARLDVGASLVLSVPAHQARMGPWDAAAGHYRRYGREDLVTRLTTAGLVDVSVLAYSFPLGYVLELGRNVMASRVARPAGMDHRTSASGRLLQPEGRLGLVTRAVAAPFRLIQRPFAGTDLGTGFVAVGRRPG